MGYIPTYTPKDKDSKKSTQDFQTDGMFQDDGQGEVFRYRQTGKVKPEDNQGYSEIGFYHRAAKLPAAEADKGAYLEFDPYGCPKIDRLIIHSTGDIYESAVNYHSMKAKRFYLNVNNEAASISLSASGEITIEASKITLKAGRTSVSLSDDGFSATSKIVNTPLPNTYDASISLKPRAGFSASGINCKIAGINKASLSDSLGGSFSSGLGVMSIKGREIKLANYNATEYKVSTIISNIELAENIITTSVGKSATSTTATQIFISWVDWVKKLIKVVSELLALDKAKTLANEKAAAAAAAAAKQQFEDEVTARAYGKAINDHHNWDALAPHKQEEYLKTARDELTLQNIPPPPNP
jgi:hypothetical protein